jgi:histidyl-tRNA synthetase
VNGSSADIEIVNIAYKIMTGFGAKNEDFIIRVNDRRLIKNLFERFGLNEEASYKASKIIDKKDKISKDAFNTAFEEILGDKTSEFVSLLESHEKLLDFLGESDVTKEMVQTIEELLALGVKNVAFDPTLMRGFDYYTGFVFEVFDTDPENSRSVFGGGRYDELMDIFGTKKIPTVGFGAGDVTARDFLEKHNLLPIYRPRTTIYVCTVGEEFRNHALDLAEKIRSMGVNTAVDLSDKKLGDQLKTANKHKIPFVICIGEDEVKTGEYTLKNMDSREEKKVRLEEITANL